MSDVRDRNAGSLYLRLDSLRWTAAVSMNGKRPTLACSHLDHRRSETKPCAEAKANLAELIRLRDARAPADGHLLTLGQYLRRWLEDVRPNLAPATWRKYESICRVHVDPALGSVRLSELSVGDVRKWLSRPSRAGGQSRRHHRATLRRALADALRDGLVTRNVAALAEPPSLAKPERTWLTASQCRALIQPSDDRFHALWVLAVTTGMREAEMLGLTWEDVDLGDPLPLRRMEPGILHAASEQLAGGGAAMRQGKADGSLGHHPTVTVRHTLQRIDGAWELRPPKTAKSRRSVPLPALTVSALRVHRARQLEERAKAGKLGPDGLVFTSERGLPLHGSNLTKALYAELDRLGLPRVTVHDLRHSAATLLYSLGVDISTIADILGHSSSRVTDALYRHRVGEAQRDAATRMQEALG